MQLPGRGEAIGPTAHYTGQVWVRNGLSDPALDTAGGRALFASTRPATLAARVAGRPTLEGILLARHLVIDELLAREIETGRIGQVIEIAAGLSGRGLRFVRSYEGLTYIEADLPGMAARKRELLSRAGDLAAGHRVVEIDAFLQEGEGSLPSLAAGLDGSRGLAVISEGLVHYFNRPAVTELWARVAGVLGAFPHGVYYSELHLRRDHRGLLPRAVFAGVSLLVRRLMHVHFEDDEDALVELRDAGFGKAVLHHTDQHPAAAGVDGASARLVRVIEASPAL